LSGVLRRLGEIDHDDVTARRSLIAALGRIVVVVAALKRQLGYR